MKIGGTIVSSLECPGKISLVIFMAKCPLRCPYCHNSELLENGEEVSIESIFKIIDDSIDYIDAVVLSGGEPLVQLKELIEILEYSKSLGLETKLDTSACYPEKLKEVIPFIDYVAIDIKAPFNKYKEIIGSDIGDEVQKSMEIAMNSLNILVECRTTYISSLLTHEDIKQISREIKCDFYTLQQFRNKNVLDNSLKDVEGPKPDELKKLAYEIKPILKNVRIKTYEFGEEIIE